MEHCRITFSANAGMALQLRNKRILIDALHDKKVPPFSTVSPALWEQIRTHPDFVDPDVIFFTHCHEDHYSQALTMEAKRLWPGAVLVLPEQEFGAQYLLYGSETKFVVDEMVFRFLRLTHEGEQYVDVPHYGLLIEGPDFRILIAADCKLANPQLTKFLEGKPVDLAILEFPWITLRTGWNYVEEVLKPRHLLINHIPFPQDDLAGYRDAAIHAAKCRPEEDIRLLLEPLQQEEFDI